MEDPLPAIVDHMLMALGGFQVELSRKNMCSLPAIVWPRVHSLAE